MLTINQEKMCALLFLFRGMPAALLTKYFYEKRTPSYSNEKYMYAVLKQLIKKGYVTYKPIIFENKNVSFYYLTPKGLEQIKNYYQISPGQNGNGILPERADSTFWDIPYEYYKPPLKQTDHYIQLLEFLHIFYCTDMEDICFYTSHYAVLYYWHAFRQQKLRPDAMVVIKSDKYAVEVDTSTEWHKQLTEKFRKYKAYLDDCDEKGEVPEIRGILFVMAPYLSGTAYFRRWNTVVRTYVEIFGLQELRLNLILTSMDRVENWLDYTLNYSRYEASFKQNVTSFVGEHIYIKDEIATVDVASNKYNIILSQLNYPYEIKALYDFFDNYQRIEEYEYLKVKVNDKVLTFGDVHWIQGCSIDSNFPKYNDIESWKIHESYYEMLRKYKNLNPQILGV